MGNRKKIGLWLLTLGLLWMIGNPVFATPAISGKEPEIYINDKRIHYYGEYGRPFYDENSRTQVPLRLTMSAMGAKVSWDEVQKKAIIVLDHITVEVPSGKYYILKNGQSILNDTKMQEKDGRMYIPIRVVSEAFGAKVKWEDGVIKIQYKKPSPSVKRIPHRYDLREYNKVSSVKNQADSGTCWAFASLAAMESRLLPWEEFDFSEDHMSLGHGYNLSQAQGGDYMIALSYLTRWAGPVLETEDPFGDGIVNRKAAPVKRLQEVLFLPKEGRIALKRAILTYGAVQSSMHLDQVYRPQTSEYYNPQEASYYYYGNQPVNHDVLIVGWDDNYPKENFKNPPQMNGAFLCKNSFGTEFGKDGYFYVSYEDKFIGQNGIVYSRIDEVNQYQNIYQSDKLGNLKQAGYGEEDAYFSNVYQTKRKEKLRAVSFYAMEPNTGYEVYLVSDFKDAGDFTKMQRVAKGSFFYAGYYTVDLERAIPIEGKFAVVVKIHSPGSKHPIATEAKGIAEWVGEVDLSDGEGYVSYDGKAWKRSEEYLEANLCLKAFTDKE